ncbi:MAG: S8 family serine peptidase [Eubacterium sp.]|nr:S8 family serine peptidase [Eubacterium sp.]
MIRRITGNDNKRSALSRITALAAAFLLSLSLLRFPSPDHSYSAEASDPSGTVIIYKEDESLISPEYDTGHGLDTLILPAYAAGYKVTWESSDADVASVDSRGRIHGNLTGRYKGASSASCMVTATVEWNGSTASDTVEVIVKDDGSSSYSDMLDIDSSTDSSCMAEGQLIAVFDKGTSNSTVRETAENADAECESIMKNSSGSKVALINTGDCEDVTDTARAINEESNVAYVQPNYLYQLEAESSSALSASGSSRYEYASQYFHTAANIPEAWDLLYDRGISQTTTVGVVDTGVDAGHTALKDNLILDENGKYTAFRDSKPEKRTDDHGTGGHGTHVTGIICAKYDDKNDSLAEGDPVFCAGTASGKDNDLSRVLVTGFGRKGSRDFSTFDVIAGINYLAENDAEVINMSFGGSYRDTALGDTVLDHYYNDGIVFVSSAGNISTPYEKSRFKNGELEFYNYPADMKEVISVCNIDESGARNNTYNTFSGTAKDISAPGTHIYSTLPGSSSTLTGNRYGYKDGSSMSSPVVSGVAALILDADPDLTPEEVRNIICATASDREGDENYYLKNELGYGAVDAGSAVQAAYDAKDRKGPSDSEPLSISIKTRNDGEPQDTALCRSTKKTGSSTSITKVSSVKADSVSGKIDLSFSRSDLVKKTVTRTTATDLTTGKTYDLPDTVKTSRTKTGVKYMIKAVRSDTGTSRTCRIAPAVKDTAKYKVTSVKTSSMKVTLKKFGGLDFRKGKTYTISIRAYRTTGGKTKYSSWISKKVRIS